MKQVLIELNGLHRGQRTVLKHARRFNMVPCGRRWGKTNLSKYLIVEAALRGEKVGLFAPAFKDIKDTWESVVKALEPVIKHKDESQKTLTLHTGGLVEFWSLVHAGLVGSGRGRDYDLVIYDECQKISSSIFRDNYLGAVRPTLIKTQGRSWFFGTPPDSRSHFFYELICRGAVNNPKLKIMSDMQIPNEILQDPDPDFIAFRAPTASNPLLPQSEIDSIRKQLPSFVFEQEIMCRFIESSGQMFLQALQDESIAERVFSRSNLFDKRLDMTLTFDFNNNPMAAVLMQHTVGFGEIRAVKEFGAPTEKATTTIYETLNQFKQYIFNQYGIKIGTWGGVNYGCNLPVSLKIVGDGTGNAVNGQQPEKMSWYMIIKKELGLPDSAFEYLKKSNPTHDKSFLQCNIYLEQHTKIFVDAAQCPRLKADMYGAKITAERKIDKANYDPHYLDCWRYFYHGRLPQVFKPSA